MDEIVFPKRVLQQIVEPGVFYPIRDPEKQKLWTFFLTPKVSGICCGQNCPSAAISSLQVNKKCFPSVAVVSF